MDLYPYQQRVDALLRAGRSVILQAPTGAGKTRAALFPFLDGWRNDPTLFPRQCIYAVPMRVLANQFEAEYQKIVSVYRSRFGLAQQVKIQTGIRALDRRFEADLIFTTLDQALSSFLTIPHSLGNRQANLNAGALISSYLVFDEFHLFPVDESGNGALATTLHMLQMLRGVTPFVLMTATFSSTMITRLAALLDAEPITLTVEEIAALPSQKDKQRRYRFCPESLHADHIINDLHTHQRRRVIAICNTVDRAQALAQSLQNDPRMQDVGIELLHSRFFASDREAREERIRTQFGEGYAEHDARPMVLVATQVVEVGLNITCDILHTELAPAASLIQRAGRCARFANESGEVIIYELPCDDKGETSYAPYHDEGQRPICEQTRTALLAQLAPEGKDLRYHDELALVDAAHSAYDEHLLAMLQQRRHQLQESIEHVLRTQQRNVAQELIRDIDTRSVIIHPNPTETSVPNPYQYEAIGLRANQLQRWYKSVYQYAFDHELDWIAKIAIPEETSGDIEGAEQGRRITTRWHTLPPSTNDSDIRAHLRDLWSSGYLVALNPALVQYTSDVGLLLLPGATPAGYSAIVQKHKDRDTFGPIQHETYAEHIAGLNRFYHNHLKERTAAARHRLEQRFGLKQGALDRAIRLMFATHDLGKLDVEWQRWAHRWQARVAELRQKPDLAFPPGYMAAHTDFDSGDPRERQAQYKIRPPRPNHATESAQAGRDLIRAVSEGHDGLYAALMSAIVCHHSVHLRTDHGKFKPAPGAKAAFYEAMRVVGLFDDADLRASGARVAWGGFPAAEGLSEAIIQVGRLDDVLLYLFLVRILRLADQGSQTH